LATSISTRSTPEDFQLMLKRQREEWFVRSLVLGTGTGEVLYFALPAAEATPASKPAHQLQ
ncbi:MAG TPA: hypothetical protein VK466_09430, partial [Terriglobales bacterium]|nr:hypothetical protein [Terriglobales bacterium]